MLLFGMQHEDVTSIGDAERKVSENCNNRHMGVTDSWFVMFLV